MRQQAHDPLDVESTFQPDRVGSGAPGACASGLLNQPARQGMVGLVTGSVGDDKPLDVEAQQSQVTDQVEYFVACALVRVTHGVSDDPLAAENQEVGRGCPGA